MSSRWVRDVGGSGTGDGPMAGSSRPDLLLAERVVPVTLAQTAFPLVLSSQFVCLPASDIESPNKGKNWRLDWVPPG